MPSLKYIKIKSKAQVPDHLDPPNHILRLGCIQVIWGPYFFSLNQSAGFAIFNELFQYMIIPYKTFGQQLYH